MSQWVKLKAMLFLQRHRRAARGDAGASVAAYGGEKCKPKYVLDAARCIMLQMPASFLIITAAFNHYFIIFIIYNVLYYLQLNVCKCGGESFQTVFKILPLMHDICFVFLLYFPP